MWLAATAEATVPPESSVATTRAAFRRGRQLGAGGNALDALEAEHAVGGDPTRLDTQRLLGVVEELVAAGSDPVAPGRPAAEKLQGADQHRLTGAGLPGYYHKAGARFDPSVLEQAEIGNVELFKHR